MRVGSASDRVGARARWRKVLRVIFGFVGVFFFVAAGYFFRPLVIDWEDDYLHEQAYGNIQQQCDAELPPGSSRKMVAQWVARHGFQDPDAKLSYRMPISLAVATKPAADVCGPYTATINFDFDSSDHLVRTYVFPATKGDYGDACEYTRNCIFP